MYRFVKCAVSWLIVFQETRKCSQALTMFLSSSATKATYVAISGSLGRTIDRFVWCELHRVFKLAYFFALSYVFRVLFIVAAIIFFFDTISIKVSALGFQLVILLSVLNI